MDFVAVALALSAFLALYGLIALVDRIRAAPDALGLIGFCALLLAIVPLLGGYIARVYTSERVRPVEARFLAIGIAGMDRRSTRPARSRSATARRAEFVQRADRPRRPQPAGGVSDGERVS